MHNTLERILILDFGSQYTQLIARRLRELHVYSEIIPSSTKATDIAAMNPSGIILSGGPNSTHENLLDFDKQLLKLNTPILGICYGMQLLNVVNKGSVKKMPTGEYGKQAISLDAKSQLFKGLKESEIVWMSHGDSVVDIAKDFKVTATSHDGIIAAFQHNSLPHFGLQFHPEVTHTPCGTAMLENFLDICKCKKNWSLNNYIESIKEDIRKQVGNQMVVSLASGGVDSTASTLLCYEALGKEKVIPLHIDNGLMRANESEQVIKLLKEHGFSNLVFVDASEEFVSALKGITDPEKKRQIIGNLFIEVLEREIKKLDANNGKTFLCQGTLYTDLIESGKGCGKNAAVIKTHHNVNPPIVEEKRRQGLIVEPNAGIFKDEVREVCKTLGVPHKLAWRHPFPGPGLAIRILGEITQQRLDTLKHADKIFLEEIEKASLYDAIWQAFAILIPVSTVGVMGDSRTEGNVIALRAVTSRDGMTADISLIPYEVLGRVSTRIINEVKGINRVVYDITSKPPGTIEWE